MKMQMRKIRFGKKIKIKDHDHIIDICQIIKDAISDGGYISDRVKNNIIRVGNLDTIKYVHSIGMDFPYNAINIADENKHRHIVRYLHSAGYVKYYYR